MGHYRPTFERVQGGEEPLRVLRGIPDKLTSLHRDILPRLKRSPSEERMNPQLSKIERWGSFIRLIESSFVELNNKKQG